MVGIRFAGLVESGNILDVLDTCKGWFVLLCLFVCLFFFVFFGGGRHTKLPKHQRLAALAQGDNALASLARNDGYFVALT